MGTTYGAGVYGSNTYGGGDNALNKVVGAVIEIFDFTGAFKTFYQMGAGPFLGLEFVLNESGPNQILLFFSEIANIEKRDQVKVKIFDNQDYFFTGVVRDIPIEGSTNTSYSYQGFGFVDYFSRTIVENRSYSTTTVRAIVEDILDNELVVKTPITKNTDKIADLTVPVSSASFFYTTVKEAMETMQNIANSDGNDYIVGVDEDGDFFFLPRETDIKVTLTTGRLGKYSIPQYNPDDTEEAKSKLFVVRSDGTFYKSFSSTENIDIFETKLGAPDISDTDIDKWAEGQLSILEKENRKASIVWEIERQSPIKLVGNGAIGIVSNIPPTVGVVSEESLYGEGLYGSGLYGGPGYTGQDLSDELLIKEIRYIINGNRASREIQLGAFPVELDREILAVNKKIDDLKTNIGR